MKWIIDKSFDFCYGHRVHNQRLDTNFTESGDACLACRHLHGHQGQVKVFLSTVADATNVQDTGMVTDFKHLGWFRNFLDDVLDHKFIMDLKDPLFANEFPLSLVNTVPMREGYCVPDLTYVKNWLEHLKSNRSISDEEADAIFEKYEGAVFVDFVPTSENLCAWLLKICQDKMKDLPGVEVVSVEFWETPKSHCKVTA